MENLKTIPNYSKYLASEDGRIYSKWYKRFLNPIIDKYGYSQICIQDDNKKQKAVCVHKFIALAFLPNPLNKPQINHINGIKTDNRVINLEWVTVYENHKHAINTGLLTSWNNSTGKNKAHILNIETGIYYENHVEASFSINMNKLTFKKILKGNSKKKIPFIYV